MLLKLLEKGVIKNIDDPVRMYDPQFNVINPFNKEQITFRYDTYLCVYIQVWRIVLCAV